MRILMIEDDTDLQRAVSYALTAQEYTVDCCTEGDDGLRWMMESAHDLVLLDRMLPRLDGISVLRRARAAGVTTPVLILTALGKVEDLVEGLDHGADDYLVKPFAIEELLARIRAISRRPRVWEAGGLLQKGGLRLDPRLKSLHCGDRTCSLSKRETDLLEILLKNAGQIIPRSTLLTHVWGPDAQVEEGNLENYIHFVRRRLKAVRSPLALSTVRGVGYILEGGDV